MILIKIGGGTSINLAGIARGLKKLNIPAIVVLGSNALREQIANRLGMRINTVVSASGHASVYSDDQLIDLMMMTYAGLQSKRFVELCQKEGINAISLSGIDGGVVCGSRNKGIRIEENGRKKVLRDLSGKPKSINIDLLELLIGQGYVPIITVPIIDEHGNAINSENDDIVALLQRSLAIEHVVTFIEASGILREEGKDFSHYEFLSFADLNSLLENSHGRFKRKIAAYQKMAEAGVKLIHVCDGRTEDPIGDMLSSKGTVIAKKRAGSEILVPRFSSFNQEEIMALEDQFSVVAFPKRQIAIVQGRGSIVWDSEGRKYIDCSGGWGTANIGHANSHVNIAILKQMNRIGIVPGIFYNDTRAKLLSKLVEITPKQLTKAFLTNSGTESIEGAMKFAMMTTGRSKFVSTVKGFHGRTLGSLALTHKKQYKDQFLPWLNQDRVTFVPFNNIERTVQAIDENTAAIVVEVVQGEGGVNIASEELLRAIRARCDETGTLMIVDEVQTGFGRTGKLFAIEWYGIEPDILCLAKSIAGGVPMGAILTSEKVQTKTGMHGTTFGGNPLACAAAIAAIDFILQQNLPEKAIQQGQYFLQKLKKVSEFHDAVREVRGIGLMVAIEFKQQSTEFIQKLFDNGVIAIPTGRNIVRFLPPLVITEDEIDQVIAAVEKSLNLLNPELTVQHS